jgi:hypothetical protein
MSGAWWIAILGLLGLGLTIPVTRRRLMWCIRQADAHDGFMTFLATVAIAILTYSLVTISNAQWGTTQNQLLEAQREFQFTERAQVVVGGENGELLELKEFGPTTKLITHLRNDGRSPANNVVCKFFVMLVAPNQPQTFHYSALNPAPNNFDYGPTLGAGFPLLIYLDLPTSKIALLREGKLGMRVVGRISYFDKFSSYCEPFGAVYLRDPPRFETEFVPPASAVCDPKSPDSETFSIVGTGTDERATVAFGLRSGEYLVAPPIPNPATAEVAH